MDDDSLPRPGHRWRSIAAAVLTAAAAAVTVFACLSGPSAATPVSDTSPLSGFDHRVPADLQGAIGGDVGVAQH
jgi:hypothetical protein